MAGWDHVVHFAEADVRVGGTYRIGFALPGKTPWIESGRYTEVVPMKRLVFEETVALEHQEAQHSNRNIVEFRDLGVPTEVTITAAGYDSWRSGEDWIPGLERLALHLAA